MTTGACVLDWLCNGIESVLFLLCCAVFQLEDLLQDDESDLIVAAPAPSAPVAAAPQPAAAASAPPPKPQPTASATTKASAPAAIKSKDDDYDDVSTRIHYQS